jgi:ATP-binding cassette subfamily F protein uup
MAIENAERSGDLVIETEDLTFSYEEQEHPIVSGLTTLIERGDRVGIVGPNGSGKTTLVRLLLGELSPDAGWVRHGTGLQVVYFDQMRENLDLDASVYDNVGGGYDRVRYRGAERHLAGYLKEFLFSDAEMKKPARNISGGETNRLLLAKLFARPSNVLVLDEPTNDLDTETLELLEQLLIDYEGTILLVSHDREFLDNVVSECLVLPGTGEVIEYSGGYSDWHEREEQRRASTGGGRSSGKRGRGSGHGKGKGAAKAAPEQSGQKRGRRSSRGEERSDRPRKLTYKERNELERLPDRIAALEQEQSEIEQQLADPSLYQDSDGERVRELSRRLEELEGEIASAYEWWEELESLA